MFSRSDGRTLLGVIALALLALGWGLLDSPPSATALWSEARRDGPQIIDLNRASAEELTALPGIGPVLAERIVRHRLVHGPFRSLEDVLQVPGIGPRTLEGLRPYVQVCFLSKCK
jgi:competence protein ComEA